MYDGAIINGPANTIGATSTVAPLALFPLVKSTLLACTDLSTKPPKILDGIINLCDPLSLRALYDR